MSQPAICTVVGKRRNLLSVESGCCGNRERSKYFDEELLRTGVSVSEKNQRVLKDGVSALWMNDERLLGNGVSATWMNEVLNDGVSAKRRNNCWTELFRR